MRLESGSWSYHAGTEFSDLNDLLKTEIKQSDSFGFFKSERLSFLESDLMYFHLKMIWDAPDLKAKKELLGKLEKAVLALGKFNNFYEVFSITEISGVKDDHTLQSVDFDTFLYVNRSQFRYLWLVLLQYFWDNLYVQNYNEKIEQMFNIELDSMKMKRRDSPAKVKTPNPPLTGVPDDIIFKSFLDEVYQMKRQLLPLKHHMGMLLFKNLKEKNTNKRMKLEDLRDLVQGQYYTIIAQGQQTFGGQPQKEHTTNPDSSKHQNSASASVKHSGLPDEFNLDFDLDYIVNVRRSKHVKTIIDGHVVIPESQEPGSSTLLRKGDPKFQDPREKTLGKIGKIKKLFTQNKLAKQFRKIKKKLECMRKSKKKDKHSEELDQYDSDHSTGTVDFDELDKGRKII
jgi:hypothetical protein